MSDTRKSMEMDIEAYYEFCSKHNIQPRLKQAGFYKLPDPVHMNRIMLLLGRINEYNTVVSQKLTLQLRADELRRVIDMEINSIKGSNQ